MSQQSPNPYQPSLNPYVDAMLVAPCAAPRPGWLTAVCVIAIVLGGLWALLALTGIGGMFVSNAGAGFAATEQTKALQEEMQVKLREAVGVGHYATWVLLVVQSVLAAALLYGGIQSNNLKETGRNILRWACWTALVFLVVWMIAFTWNMMHTMPVTREYMIKMMEQQQQPGAPRPPVEFLANFATIVGIVTVVISGLIVLVEAIFFALAANYLGQDEVRQLFHVE